MTKRLQYVYIVYSHTGYPEDMCPELYTLDPAKAVARYCEFRFNGHNKAAVRKITLDKKSRYFDLGKWLIKPQKDTN